MEMEYIVLAKECLKAGEYTAKVVDEFDDGTEIFAIESDEARLKFWNCSNPSPIHCKKDILRKIATKLMEEEDGGEEFDGWNNVMWEVEWK